MTQRVKINNTIITPFIDPTLIPPDYAFPLESVKGQLKVEKEITEYNVAVPFGSKLLTLPARLLEDLRMGMGEKECHTKTKKKY